MAKGVQIEDRVDVQAILQTAVPPADSFAKNLFLIDSAEVPTDKRVVEVTRSDFADVFDSTGLAYAYAQTHFSQKRTPDSLLVGRYIKAASPTYSIMGGDYETTLAIWTAISDGSLAVDLNGTPTDVTGIDLASATTLEQVWALITAAIQAVFADTSAELAVDNFDRLVFTSPGNTGATNTVQLKPVSPATGTDLATLLDYLNQTPVAGSAAESIVDAIDAVEAIDSSGYFITMNSYTEADLLLFAGKIESMEKIGIVMSDDTDIKDPAKTDDPFSQLKALGYKRTAGIYYESISSRPTMFPDSAGLGAVMPAKEGTTKFCQEALVGVTGSGYSSPLSKGESDVVNDKNGMVVEFVGDVTYWFDGLTFGGEEIRIMLGRDWFVSTIRNAIFAYTIQQPLTAFDNETLTAIAGFISDAGEEAILRRILVNTAERPFSVNLPDADDFTQAERASHKMEVFDAFQAYLNSAVNEYKIIGTWTI